MDNCHMKFYACTNDIDLLHCFFYLLHSKELLYGVQSFFTDGYRIMWEK